MNTYFTSTRTLTISRDDFRTIENMQEEMEKMTSRDLDEWTDYVYEHLDNFTTGTPELVEDSYGEEIIYKLPLEPLTEYSNEEDRDDDEDYVEVDENEVAIYISKYRIFDFLDTIEESADDTIEAILKYLKVSKTIDFDKVAELMAANYCPWMEDVPVYISRRGNNIRFTIDYVSVMETVTEMDENYMQFYNEFDPELSDLLTIGVKAERVSGLDDMIDDDSTEISYTANKYNNN